MIETAFYVIHWLVIGGMTLAGIVGIWKMFD